VFVNPYMTLVASYERLIQARGQEIKEQDIREDLPEMAKRLDNNDVLGSARAAVSAQEAQTLSLLPRPRPPLPPRTVRTHLANRGPGVVHQAPVLRLAPRLEPGRRNIWTSHHKVSFDAPERQSSHP
jgi:hypothetical protein